MGKPGPPQGGGNARGCIYVFPCRIQQGSGEWFETARALRSLAAAGARLLYLRPHPADPPPRDPRAVPLDPTRPGPGPFPRVVPVREPVPADRAVAVVTWYGLTAELEDPRGSPNPGPFARRFERLRAGYPGKLLVLSLEEFGTARSSRAAMQETRRQSGATRAGSIGRRRSWSLYHHAFVAARAGERRDVLHLVPEFSPDPRALREFPFYLPVPPFGERPPPPGEPEAPRRSSPGLSLLWYAPARSCERIYPELLRGLERVGPPVRLRIRAPGADESTFPSPPRGSRVRVLRLGPVPTPRWEKLFREADLRIVGGSQSLVEAWNVGGPFLYFNGCLEGNRGRRVGFRREKLLSLLRRWPSARATRLREDLRNFADGRQVEAVVRRALGSSPWRRRFVLERLRDRDPYPPLLRPSEDYLRRLVEGYLESGQSAVEYARGVRQRHRALLTRTPSGPTGERARAPR